MEAIKITFTDSGTGVVYTDSHHLISQISIDVRGQRAKIFVAVFSNNTAFLAGKRQINDLNYYIDIDGSDYTSYISDVAERGSTSSEGLSSKRVQDYLMTLTKPYDFLNKGTAL